MTKALLATAALAVAACDYSVENSMRTLGGDAVCISTSRTTHVVCSSRTRLKSYLCFASPSVGGDAVCLEGIPSPSPAHAGSAAAERTP